MQARLKMGLIAGVAATAVVSVMELVNIMVLKWFQPFPLIVANILGQDGNLAVGWALHIAAGVLILGPLFGYLVKRMPTDTPETKGIVFAVGAFIAMLVAFMFLGDWRTFGNNIGTLGWMLITNAVFGIVLGNVYARLERREKLAHPIGAAPAH